MLNDNIERRRLDPNISTKDLKEIFYSLIARRKDWLVAVECGGLVLIMSLFTEWLVVGITNNLLIISVSGLISIFLLAIFTTFFIQRFFFPTLQQCRALLSQRGETVKEPESKFNNLRIKFSLFLLVPIIVVLMVLGFIVSFNLEIIIFSLIGLGMAIAISRVLSFSIYQAFEGIKNFAKELPTSQRTMFSTGSLDKEVLDLSASLNKAAEEVYIARQELEEAKTDLEKRVDELERFHSLTVGRELKMVELKKKIKEIEDEEEEKK